MEAHWPWICALVVLFGAVAAGAIAVFASRRWWVGLIAFVVVGAILWIAAITMGFTHMESTMHSDVCEVAVADAAYATKPRASSHRVVISLTTLPGRIDDIYPTILSLLTQTVRADEIALNIPWETRKGQTYVIPEWMAGLQHVRVHRFSPDPGPSAKLLPTLVREPDATIVVIDDDNVYGDRVVEGLVTPFDEAGRTVVMANGACDFRERRTFCVSLLVGLTKGLPFENDSYPKECLFGVRGFAVTARMFPQAVLSYTAPPVGSYETPPPPGAVSIDDDWFAWWLLAGGTSIRGAPGNLLYRRLGIDIAGTSSVDALSAEHEKQMQRAIELKDWFAQERIFERMSNGELGGFLG